MTHTHCDRCSKDIGVMMYVLTVVTYVKDDKGIYQEKAEGLHLDLCPSCRSALRDYLSYAEKES